MQQGFISFGLLTFHFYGFFIALGLVFLYFYARKNCSLFGILPSNVDAIFLVIIFSSIIGARIYHVLSWWYYYRLFPKEIFFVWQGGLGIFGAIAGSTVGVFLYSIFKKRNYLNILCLFSPPLLLTQAIGRIGNYFNIEAFGPPTNLPWGVFVPLNTRPIGFLDKEFFHPTFFYEAILCAVAFFVFLFVRKKIKKVFYFSYYLVTYGTIRIFTEFFRFDTWTVMGFKIAYVLSLIMIITGVLIVVRLRNENIRN